ncbi:methyltransferase domain-containing protein [Saccharopolyspora sp. ID03-671]|uniref:methyltransferase domain-containing protein n=1 Tax=Saccharopolyspora sp. ID03-671 TaxID=3073066 RepID=UPI00324CBE6F
MSESDLPLRAEKIDADAEHLPFPDRSFDAVVCRFALSRAANPALAAREIARVLRWKGHLLFLEAAGDARRVDPVTHLRISGLVTHDIERTRTRAHPRWLVQGIATHPSAQYEREIAWLLGTARGGNHDDEESSGLPQGSQ